MLMAADFVAGLLRMFLVMLFVLLFVMLAVFAFLVVVVSVFALPLRFFGDTKAADVETLIVRHCLHVTQTDRG